MTLPQQLLTIFLFPHSISNFWLLFFLFLPLERWHLYNPTSAEVLSTPIFHNAPTILDQWHLGCTSVNCNVSASKQDMKNPKTPPWSWNIDLGYMYMSTLWISCIASSGHVQSSWYDLDAYNTRKSKKYWKFANTLMYNHVIFGKTEICKCSFSRPQRLNFSRRSLASHAFSLHCELFGECLVNGVCLQGTWLWTASSRSSSAPPCSWGAYWASHWITPSQVCTGHVRGGRGGLHAWITPSQVRTGHVLS